MAKIIKLGKAKYPRRFYGECQRCQRMDYLPWATEYGGRFCGHCFEKNAIGYVELAGWTRPASDPLGLENQTHQNATD